MVQIKRILFQYSLKAGVELCKHLDSELDEMDVNDGLECFSPFMWNYEKVIANMSEQLRLYEPFSIPECK